MSYDERWILRQITNNPKVRDAEKTLFLRQFEEYWEKIIYIEEWPERKAFISQKTQKVRMEFADNRL